MIKLADILEKDNNIVYTYGLEEAKEKNLDNYVENDNLTLEEKILKSNIIICPIPLSKDDETIYMPYKTERITIQEVLEKLEEKIFIAGNISKKYYKIAKDNNVKIIDIMNSEDLVIYNTIATAEGTIKIMIENTDENLHGKKVLILGFGRVAKTLAMKLNGLQMDITCVARKAKDIALIETYGYKSLNLYSIIDEWKNFDYIINTIPYQILKEKELSFVKKETVLIDLASKPGGILQEEAEKNGLKSIWALALPGKVSPQSSAEYIKKAIYNVI